jgi:7,8-didemethyl-8-hydroxy-5-deazariboflavin synthase CofG subunit
LSGKEEHTCKAEVRIVFISQGATDNDALMRCDNDLEHVSKILDEIKHSSYHISGEQALSLFYDARLEQLVECSSYLRDKFKPSILTYSRKVFVNLVNLCRDTCTYCTYKKEPGDTTISMLDPEKVLAIVEVAKRLKCTEALIVTGERPEVRYQEVRNWLQKMGFSTLSEYIGEVCEMIIKKTGLLPHTNAGSLSKQELLALRENNASMGLMLESSSIRLSSRGMPHERAPSKYPRTRLKSLTTCGELNIPTTTGLLIGIGETPEEIVESLLHIKSLHKAFGHIQEVIMQNFSPKDGTLMSDHPAPSKEYFMRAVAIARILMPKMNIQVPPNLNESLEDYIGVGINDWGGISPVTIDYVNPEHPWPPIERVNWVSSGKGFQLKARLPVYPEFLNNGRSYISPHVRSSIEALSDDEGLVKESYLI